MSVSPVIIVLGPSGLGTARRIKAALEGADIHGLKARVPDADVTFEKTAAHIADLFREGKPLIGICASGILVRALGPHLASKHEEPPVIAAFEKDEKEDEDEKEGEGENDEGDGDGEG